MYTVIVIDIIMYMYNVRFIERNERHVRTNCVKYDSKRIKKYR